MKKLGVLIAGLYMLAMLGSMPAAQAHTAANCKKELQQYSKLCIFSPTAFILGFCKNKKAQAWCSDKKKHEDKFHK